MEPMEPMEEAHVAAAIDMDAEMAKLLAEINSVAEPSLGHSGWVFFSKFLNGRIRYCIN